MKNPICTPRAPAGTHRRPVLIPLIATSFLVMSASLAAGQDGAGEKGRFTMSPVDNGFARLDTHTGAMSFCRRTEGSWNCEPMADAGDENRTEVEKLRKENAELRAEIKRLDDMLGLGDGSRPGTPGGGQQGFGMPTEKDVDQALDYFERLVKKFQDRLKRLEEPSARGSTEPRPKTEEPQPKPEAAPDTSPPGRKTAL